MKSDGIEQQEPEENEQADDDIPRGKGNSSLRPPKVGYLYDNKTYIYTSIFT